MRAPLREPSIAAWVGALVASSFCGCRADPEPRAAGGPLAVSDGDSGYYLFREACIEQAAEDTEEVPAPIPVDAGAPAAVGADPDGGWAAAAYERGLFAVHLGEGRMVPVAGVRWRSPPTALAVHGGLAGTVEDGTIGLYRITDGEVLWRPPAGEILAGLDVSELRFVFPRSRDELVVVGHRGMGPFSRPNTVALVVDRSSGSPTVPRWQPLPDLHVLAACTSDGRDLYLVGEQDEERLLAGTPPRRLLIPYLVLIRIDPESLERTTLLRQERPREVRVHHLAAGHGLLALSHESRELEVYRLAERSAVLAYSSRFESAVSAACLDEDRVVIFDRASARELRIPR